MTEFADELTPQAQDLVAKARFAGHMTELERTRMLGWAADRQRAILQLQDDAGLSLRRIAAELGVSMGVVQQAIRRARAAGEAE